MLEHVTRFRGSPLPPAQSTERGARCPPVLCQLPADHAVRPSALILSGLTCARTLTSHRVTWREWCPTGARDSPWRQT